MFFGASLSNMYFVELRRHSLARARARTNTHTHKHTKSHSVFATFLQIGINIFGSLSDVSSFRTDKQQVQYFQNYIT